MNNNVYGNKFIPNNMFNNQIMYATDDLQQNIGKKIEAHLSFCDSIEWRDSIFEGTIEEVGKDYLVLKNKDEKIVLWTIYMDYIIIE